MDARAILAGVPEEHSGTTYGGGGRARTDSVAGGGSPRPAKGFIGTATCLVEKGRSVKVPMAPWQN